MRTILGQDVKLGNSQSLAIDCFRIIAAAFVMIGHGLSFFSLSPLKDQTYFPYIQNIGVLVLFLLSGFFCTYSVSKNVSENNRIRNFFGCMIDRYFRLALELFVAMLFVAAIDFCWMYTLKDYGCVQGFTLGNFIGNLLMLVDVPSGGLFQFVPFGSASQLWSVSVEFWLFFVFAVAMLLIIPLMTKKKERQSALTWVFAVVVSCAALLLVAGKEGHRGIAALACFALGGFLHGCYQRIHLKKGYAIVGLLISSVTLLASFLWKKEAYTVLGCIGTFAVVFFLLQTCAHIDICTFMPVKAIKAVSQSTYMLYLVHYSIMRFAVRLCPSEYNLLAFIITCALSVVIALLGSKLLKSKHRTVANAVKRLFKLSNV